MDMNVENYITSFCLILSGKRIRFEYLNFKYLMQKLHIGLDKAKGNISFSYFKT